MPRDTLRAALPIAALAVLLAGSMPALAGEDERPAASVSEQTTEDVAAKLREQLEAWIAENRKGLTQQMIAAKIGELLADVDIESLDANQLEALTPWFTPTTTLEYRDRAIARAKELARGDDAQAAIATILLAQAVEFEPVRASSTNEINVKRLRMRREAILKALTHPGLEEALRGGHGGALFGVLSSADPEMLSEHADEVIAVAMLINGKIPPEVLARIESLLSMLDKMGDTVTAEQREAIRVRIVDALRDAIPKAREKDERLTEHLERNMRLLDGAHARGELLDHQSPAVIFTWSNNDPPLTSVADLEGKVIVLEFWATWCQPCIANFPNLRKLEKHYEGYDVAIVGVTGLMGKHFSGDGPPVDTEGDPDKEYDLMKDFITARNITWTVAFSESASFEYGVRAMPQMAILDAEGKVRYNGLPPWSSLHENFAKIDALLEEAGLPAPPPPADTDAKADRPHDRDADEGHDEDD